MVWDPHRGREPGRALERRRLGGIPPTGVRAFDEGFRYGRSGFRLGAITTGFGLTMKFTADRPYADPEVAARKLIEVANSVETV